MIEKFQTLFLVFIAQIGLLFGGISKVWRSQWPSLKVRLIREAVMTLINSVFPAFLQKLYFVISISKNLISFYIFCWTSKLRVNTSSCHCAPARPLGSPQVQKRRWRWTVSSFLWLRPPLDIVWSKPWYTSDNHCLTKTMIDLVIILTHIWPSPGNWMIESSFAFVSFWLTGRTLSMESRLRLVIGNHHDSSFCRFENHSNSLIPLCIWLTIFFSKS